MDDHRLEDTLTTVGAQLTHLQTRLLSIALRGKASTDLLHSMSVLANDISERLARLAKEQSE